MTFEHRKVAAGAINPAAPDAPSASGVPTSNGAGSSGPEAAAPKRPRSRYIPALDGLRTLAVAVVVLYHLNPLLAPGGMQGVTIFFVLSGYLITRLLIAEFDGAGRIDIKGFFVRRLRRLLPATIVVVVAVAALCTLLNHVMLTKMRPDIVPSLLYLNNWWQIFNNMSYFSAVGDPSPLTHFWSLAIEAQFYLAWPLVLMVALRSGQPRTRISRAVLAFAVVSALEMALLYNPAVDPSRVYYGTDTRAFSLLLGAWLAFVPLDSIPEAMRSAFSRVSSAARGAAGRESHADQERQPTDRRASKKVSEPMPAHLMLDLLGCVGLLGTILLVVFTNGYTAFPYRGGILLASIFALMLIAACAHPESRLAKVFEVKPLVWLGQRSYSIYLWHYPLLLLMNPVSDVSEKPWWVYVLQVTLIVAVSAASYYLIETPFRHGAFGALVKRVRGNRDELKSWAKRNCITLGVCGVVGLVALGGIALVPNTSALSEEGAAVLQGDDATASAGDSASAQGDKAPAQGDGAANDGALNSEGFPEGSYDITMIGDSVSLRAVEPFQQTFAYGMIDAAKNRQFTAGIEIYRGLLEQNLCGRVAVFALGTNGAVTDANIDELMGLVGEKRIAVFVNNRCPQPWIGPNNDVFNRAAERYSNVRVIDWYGYSANNNALFDGDGTHLTADGAVEYVNLIHSAVKSYLPIHLDNPSDERLLAVQRVLDSMRSAISIDPKPIETEAGSEENATAE